MTNHFRTVVKNVCGERLWKLLVRARTNGIVKTLEYLCAHHRGTLSLQCAGEYHGTDKHDSAHSFAGVSYLDVYDKYLHQLRGKEIAVLEIGVRDGASLRMWKAYFKNGQIYGVDIDPRCEAFEERRVHIETGSQDDPKFLRGCFGKDIKFDLIIDDGSHISRMTIASFMTLFYERLNSGGIYIIEDLLCSYDKLQTEYNILETWPGMKYNDPAKSYDNSREEIDAFFLDKVHALDHRSGAIQFVHFWAMTCVIGKVSKYQAG